MSESDVPIEISFENGLVLNATMDRVQAPLIVEDIKSMLPFEGKAVLMRGEMKITLGINRGNAKPTKNVKKRDIAYMPLGDSICIYLEDMKTFSPVNIIGSIVSDEEDVNKLREVRRGSSATLRAAEV
ncbi:hypothetical protein EU537_02225 [Candidatus Thorarchaeota archaeon]|nr:MAG: hypothetical protein EU537_02225 [Candidatus Thorarchaeota archaeon]